LLIHWAKVEHLAEHNEKGDEVLTASGKGWRVKITDYDRAPISKVKVYLDELAEEESLADMTADLAGLVDYIYLLKKRAGAVKFLRLLDDLAFERQAEWLRSQPALQDELARDCADRVLCQRIIDYIRSRPGKMVTKRELERRFSNKHRADLDRALALAWFFPPLRQRKKGKSTVLYWKPPSRKQILAYNQRVSESILLERALAEGKELGREIFVAYFPDAPKSWGGEYWLFIIKSTGLDAALERFVQAGGPTPAAASCVSA
jgi:hypothetical protein